MNKKVHITIGIIAYNEEENILHLLKSIIRQDMSAYYIDAIFLLLDGSTDHTAQQAKKLPSQKLRIISDGKRLGKTYRLNQLYKLSASDILVVMDADIVLNTIHSITQIIAPFENSDVGLVNGHLIPKNNKRFLEKAISITVSVYEHYFQSIRNGSNIYAVKGAFMALSKKLVKKVHIPSDIYADDTFLYLFCITQGYSFVYANHATAWYQLPETLNDHIAQNARFIGQKDALRKYFGDVVSRELSQQKRLLYWFMFKAFLAYPFHTTIIFFINLYSKWKAKRSTLSMLWEESRSTKHITKT